MKSLKEIGEDQLLQLIADYFAKNYPEGLTGIGDDCAVIPISEKKFQLITTDCLIENTHFILDKISPEDLGYKSIAVNLSDIAAMGGTPKYALLSIALKNTLDEKWLNEFIQGIKSALKQYNVLLLGGDTVASEKEISINVTLIGEADSDKIKYRDTAQTDDIICVTGNLGDSYAGFQCLLQSINNPELINAHHHPSAHIEQGKFLSQFKEVHAMMDLSDGLQQDLEKLCKASNCGAEVHLEKLPTSQALKEFAKETAEEIAAVGGEDYCLLLTIAKEAYPNIVKQYSNTFNKTLYPIGNTTIEKNSIQFFKDNKIQTLTVKPFVHFT